jgi:peptide/nickel transport system substrate-binding protein
MRFRTLVLAIGALALLPASPARARDDLVIGVAQFPSSLHPAIDPELIKAYVLGFALRPINAYDAEPKLVCMLCAELPTIENGLARVEDLPQGGKGIAVTVKLRPDLKWGDGEPVTTRDLEFTWRVGRDQNAGFSIGRFWTRTRSVEIVDEHTAVMHLDAVYANYNDLPDLFPEHVEGPVHAKADGPGDYIKQTTYNRAPTTPGLYNGPYLVTGYQSGAQIVLEPNPYWAGPKPAFRHIVVKAIENTAALEANLLSGDVDMVNGEGVSLSVDQVVALQKQYPDRFTYIFKPSLTYEHVDLQKDNPILADLRVRRALLLALDRKTQVQKLFDGRQAVAASFVSPADPNYTEDVPTYDYDPAKGKALLAEAGWQPGPDGICRNAAGDRLSLQLMTTAGNRLRELQEQVLQSQWKAACVEVTIKNEPARTLFGDTIKHRKYPGMVMFGTSHGINVTPRGEFGSDMIPTAANNWGGFNSLGFSNPRMDADIAAADTELDPEKRKAIWADMQRIYAEELPSLPLFHRAEAHALPKWLQGFLATGHAGSSLWAEYWHPE